MTAIKRYILPSLLVLILCVVGVGFNYQPVQASSQVIFGGHLDPLNKTDATTEYNSVQGGSTWTSSTNIFARSSIVTSSGKIKQLYVELSGAPGAGVDDTYTFTLMYDGAATALTCAIVQGATSGSDLAHEIDVVAGKPISLRVVSSGAPDNTPFAMWTMVFSGTTANESLILGSPYLAATAATAYGALAGCAPAATIATEINCRTICPTAGVIKNLYVILNNDPGDSPDAYTFTLRVGNAGNSYALTNTALTCTIVANNKTGNDTANPITVAAGDILTISCTPVDTPSVAPQFQFGLTFVATTDGESIILGGAGSTSTVSGAGTRYHGINSTYYNDAWNATETNVQQLGQVCTLRNLYVLLSDTPYQNSHSADQHIFTVETNTATPSTIVATVTSDATTAYDNTHSVTLAAGDNVCLMSTPASAPTARNAYWGLVCYIAPPAGYPYGHSFGVIIGN